MSARFCPKHSKPYPCGKCRIESAARPPQRPPAAVAVLPETINIEDSHAASSQEPELTVKFHCPVCDKTFYDAKPELYDLVSCCECSAELKVIKLRPLKLASLDDEAKDKKDAVEELKQEKFERRSGSAVSAPAKGKQPAYLKSAAHPVVPNPASKDAPYGYDDKGQAILPGRSDQQIETDLLTKPFLAPGACPHKKDPTNCLECGTGTFSKTPLPQSIKSQQDLLSAILKRDITDASKRLDVLWSAVKKESFTSYVDVLGVHRTDLIQLIDMPAGTKPRWFEDKVLKPTRLVEKHILKLKRLIQRSEELIHSWAYHVMKLRRAPENILDPETCEKYKREERARIARCKKKINELRARLRTWADNPANYARVLKTVHVPQTLRDRINMRMLEQRDISRFEDETEICSVEKYLVLWNPTSVESLFPDKSTWRSWSAFENSLVLEAVRWGLVQVDGELPANAQTNSQPEPGNDEDDHDQENILILKTGGGAIGGRIFSAGFRRGRQRALESFDKTLAYARRSETGEVGGTEPETNEDSESFTPD